MAASFKEIANQSADCVPGTALPQTIHQGQAADLYYFPVEFSVQVKQ